MKRHESILVYGVTGMLLLILFVAIVFGNEGDVKADPESAKVEEIGDPALELAELMNLDPVAPLRDAEAARREDRANEPVQVEPPAAEAAAVDLGPTVADAEEAAEPESSEPEGSPPEELEEAAATDARVGDYRKVTVERGDTFSLIVQRWCGSLDHMPVVEALNEDVERNKLTPGRVLLVPWVDDAKLEAAEKNRRAVQAKLDAERRAAEGRLYQLQRGDSLWKIAMQATGSEREVPAYIQRIQEMNPGIVPEKLRAGQSIRLPQE